MKKKCILIYEILAPNFNRYVGKMAEKIQNNIEECEVFYLVDVFTKNEDIDLPEGVNIIKTDFLYKKFKKFSTEYEIIAFVNYAYRIPDCFWTYFFKSKGVKTFQIMHGLYPAFYIRNFWGYFQNMDRKSRYLVYAYRLINANKGKKLKTLLYFINKDIFRLEKFMKIDKEMDFYHSDYIFTWGSYWENWFKEVHHFKYNTKYVVVGNYDSYIHKEVLKEKRQDAYTYIAQTLVEDGRFDKTEYLKFFDFLRKNIDKSKPFYFKPHPRSDMSLYKDLLKLENVIVTREFPQTKYYLGHYSTLLTVCFSEDSEVFLWEFPKHEIAFYFKVASYVSNDESSLIDFLKGNTSRFEKPKSVGDSVFKKTEIDPDLIVIDYIKKEYIEEDSLS